MSDQPNTQAARERLTKLFEFLKAYTDLRFPPVRDIDQQLRFIWLRNLPTHPCVELFRDIAKPEEAGEDQDHDVVLRITRPKVTPCPPPPEALAEWLKPGWQEPSSAVEIEPARERGGASVTGEKFEADPSRASSLRLWLKQREQWMANERPAREALALFQSVYEWFGIKEREGERIEMLVGDGLLDCPQKTGEKFRHPILLQRLELEFYPEKREPQFVFRKREQQPELYLEFLRVLPKVNTQQLARCADELKKAEFTPLGGEDTDGFLRRLIQGLFPSSGRFVENEQTASPTGPDKPPAMDAFSLPSIWRQPVIFMRQRRTGPGNVFDLVLEDIGSRENFSSSLLRILGLVASGSTPVIEPSIGETFGNEDEQVLLSKPANREQLEIAKQLARRDCVLVQGPPGTGKTHTIANLVGHLLSQGKRVLVTAHTPKALRVLRPKIVESLQPLCISVLQNDKHSQEELQASVRKIHVRLSDDERLLERDAERTRTERKRILEALAAAREKLLAARQDEIRDVVFAEKALRPIAAARRVKEGVGREDWIPGPVNAGETMPLSAAEVSELYQTNARVSAEDEHELACHRPILSAVPTPKEFGSTIEKIAALAKTELRLHEELWDSAREPEDLTEFERLLELASKAIESLRDSAPWQLEAVQAGRDGAEARQVWESLAGMIENSWREIQECNGLIMEHGPEISDPRTPRELLPLVEAMIQHKDAGHSFGRLAKLTHRNWFEFGEKVRIGQRALDLEDATQLRAVRALLRMRHLRTELVERWGRQMALQGGLACSELSERPEQVCKQFVPQIQHCLEWQTATWQPLEDQLQRLGFNWPAFLESTAPEPGDNAGLRRIRRAVLGELGPILQSRSRWLRHQRLQATWRAWRDEATEASATEAQATHRLQQAMCDGSPADYRAAYEELARLKNLEPALIRRHELLERLAQKAPAWASAIENRIPRHKGAQPAGEPNAAWEWRQIHDELERRASVSVNELQQEIERLGHQLLAVTAQLVEKQTWQNQIRQTSSGQKQALGAYAAVRNKLTKTGKGVRDAELRAAARREMATAKDAVPVWIMPLAELAETFDPRRTQFDVVIIDEASQCDPTSLFALYLGRQAIVVGDDEQVTPVAVGVQGAELTKLITILLEGVPYKELYDGETSIYELAQIAFGGVIRLTEHFRCAPNIIAFSNQLSYRGEIKALREASSIPLMPHVVAHRVEDGRERADNVNDLEAETVASLICAAIEQPEYALNHEGEATSFGVVSLVSDRQALRIDAILRHRIEPAEYRRRKILCGDSAQFQGDERDVMFLSVVDSSAAKPPLPMRQEGQKNIFRKRYNVAASRGRNQMWIVHSLNHETDLQVGDYRRRLIEHALDPAAWERELQKKLARTDPRAKEFQGLVLRRLLDKRYAVTPDFPAGAFAIDLVVTGNGRRLAIECDGEQFHSPEKLREDLERQAILERLGWTFLRIRGSLFFRDEERALAPVYRRLEELNIAPKRVAEAEATVTESEVIERVIQRAEELRKAWQGAKGSAVREVSAIIEPRRERKAKAQRQLSGVSGSNRELAGAKVESQG